MAHHPPQTAEILTRELAAATGHPATQSLDDAALPAVGSAEAEEGLRFVPTHTLTTDDEMLVVCGHASAQRQTRQLDTGTSYVVLLREGRVREMWLAHQDQANFDDFWS